MSNSKENNFNCKCDFCGKKFHKSPSKIHKRNFCSRKCQNTYFAHKERDLANKNLNCICTNCGRKFHRGKSKNTKRQFCNIECYKEYLSKQKTTKKCIVCGNEFISYINNNTNKFCSTECQIKYQKRFFIHTKCSYCGKEIIVNSKRQKQSKNKIYFCSNKCIGKYFRGKNNPRYNGKNSVNKILRSYYEKNQRHKIFKKYNKICQICGSTANHIHHIKHISTIVDEYCKNNNIDVNNIEKYKLAYDIIKNDNYFLNEKNLVALCEKCHKKQHKKNNSFMNIVNIDYGMSDNSYSIFFSGCNANPKCDGCHNPESWNFNIGKNWLYYLDKINDDISEYNSLINKIIIVGGEPLDQNLGELENFLIFISKFNIPIYLFTRYELNKVPNFVKEYCQYIKCGMFIPSLLCDNNFQYSIKLATSNQKIFKKGLDY